MRVRGGTCVGGRTVGEEFAEHEGVIRLGVVLREPDVLVHVERHDVREAGENRSAAGGRLGGRGVCVCTHESFPSFTSLIRAL